MNTKIWNLQQDITQEDNTYIYNEIKNIFENGGLVAIPTETVYGLGGDARNEAAIKKIYSAKGRPSDNPLIVHIHDIKQLECFTQHITQEVKTLMQRFWPGPISFILPLKKGYLCESVSGGLSSIAVRMPSHPVGRKVLKFVDLPIAAPSANLSGRPSPTQFEHVYNDLNHRIDGIIDGDESEEGLESTVLDCTQYPFKIARPGSITKTMIESVLPDSISSVEDLNHEKPIAPGMKYKHYAPDTPITIVQSSYKRPSSEKNWQDTAFIFTKNKRDLVPKEAIFMPLCENEKDIKGANRHLYQVLHDIDQNNHINHAYIFGFENNDDTTAIMNRMLKTANYTVVKREEL